MKKLLLLSLLAITFTSCDGDPNIKTIEDNVNIPVTITQLAEAKRDLLQKDTLNTVLNEQFKDKDFEYDYKITKNKVEFQRAICLEQMSINGVFLILFLGMLLGILITLVALH